MFKTYVPIPKTIESVQVTPDTIDDVTDWLNRGYSDYEFAFEQSDGCIWTRQDGTLYLVARYGDWLVTENGQAEFKPREFMSGWQEA